MINGADPSLVSYWKFDEGTGTVASDASGNGNSGSLLNGPTWATGHAASAVSLDGVNDYVNIAPKIATLLNSTVAAWFKTTSTAAEDIYSEGSSGDGTPLLRIVVNRSGVGNLGFEHRDNANLMNSIHLPVNANNGAWHHVALVRTALNAWKLYFDGALIASFMGSNPGALTVNRAAIGSLLRTSPSSYFNGQIDEVRLYNRALTQAEVQTIAQ